MSQSASEQRGNALASFWSSRIACIRPPVEPECRIQYNSALSLSVAIHLLSLLLFAESKSCACTPGRSGDKNPSLPVIRAGGVLFALPISSRGSCVVEDEQGTFREWTRRNTVCFTPTNLPHTPDIPPSLAPDALPLPSNCPLALPPEHNKKWTDVRFTCDNTSPSPLQSHLPLRFLG